MRQAPYALVIFDFDGTLVDSERCIHEAMAAALAERGVAGDLSRLRRQIGMPLDRSIRSLIDVQLDDSTVATIIDTYRRHHMTLQRELIQPYPGVPAALRELSQAGVRLAIATSKVSTAVEATLEQFEISDLFACVVGGEQVVNGKPDPEMIELVLARVGERREEALVVGDTVFDVAMAHRAQMDSCAVTYGNQTAEQLSNGDPTYLASSIEEVVRFIEPRRTPTR